VTVSDDSCRKASPRRWGCGGGRDWGIDPSRLDAYLERIGAIRPARPDAEALRELQHRHLLAVPFENLSIYLHEPIVLDEAALLEKIVDRRRGGFCYELNGLFGMVLRALGYETTYLGARVFQDEGLGPPFDHLALRVDCPEPWLVDVGFGRHAHYPLRLDVRTDQDDPDGTYRIVESPEGDIDVLRSGRPQYRAELRPRALGDCEATCWWHQTSPKSHFTQSTVCSLLTENGRVTLSEGILIRTVDGQRFERRYTSDADLLEAYRTWFGVALDRVPVRTAR
jgi:N-hydroxyarylamine O-acetyltransferase